MMMLSQYTSNYFKIQICLDVKWWDGKADAAEEKNP